MQEIVTKVNPWNIFIREAKQSDFDSFIKVFSIVEELHRINLNWKYKKPDILFSKEEFNDMINDNDTKIYLACFWELVVWILLAYVKRQKDKPVLKDRIYIDIDSICVLDEYRNLWIWKMLLSKIEDRAKDNNILDIQLNVREFNKNAKNFYLNNWFDSVSSIMRKTL